MARLQAVLPGWDLPVMTIYALYPSRRHLSPAVRALLDFWCSGLEGAVVAPARLPRPFATLLIAACAYPISAAGHFLPKPASGHSLRLNPGGLDHLAPLQGLGGLRELGQVGGVVVQASEPDMSKNDLAVALLVAACISSFRRVTTTAGVPAGA